MISGTCVIALAGDLIWMINHLLFGMRFTSFNSWIDDLDHPIGIIFALTVIFVLKLVSIVLVKATITVMDTLCLHLFCCKYS